MPFNNYPYTNLNDLNLDFLIKKAGDITGAVETAIAAAAAAEDAAQRAEDAADTVDFPFFRSNHHVNVTNSPGAIGRVLKCAGSYLRNPIFQYGNFHTAFNTSCVPDASTGLYDIDCVSFVELCLKGIDFAHSRYSGVNNQGQGGIYFVDPVDYVTTSRPYGMLSGQLARYATNNGWAWTPAAAYELLPGDVVFCHTGDVESSWPGSRITHCALVVDVYGDNITCVEAYNTGVTIRLKSRKIDTNDIIMAARFPFQDIESDETNYFLNQRNNIASVKAPVTVNIGTGVRTATVKTIILPDDFLVSGQPYTFSLSCPQNKPDWEWFLRFKNLTVAAKASPTAQQYCDRVFYINQEETPAEPLGPNSLGFPYVELLLRIPAASSYSGQITFDALGLYKGYQIAMESHGQPVQTLTGVNSITDCLTEEAFIQVLDNIAYSAPVSQFVINFVRLATGGSTIPANRYIVLTWVFGSTRAQGIQMILGMFNGKLLTRYSVNGAFNTFESLTLHS